MGNLITRHGGDWYFKQWVLQKIEYQPCAVILPQMLAVSSPSSSAQTSEISAKPSIPSAASVKKTVHQWAARSELHIQESDLDRVVNCIAHAFGSLAPKFLTEQTGMRSIFLPKHRDNNPEGTFVLINDEGKLLFFDANHPFAHLSKQTFIEWPTKLRSQSMRGRTSPKHLSGFSPLTLPDTWTNEDGVVVRHWCASMASRIHSKGVAPLSNQKLCLALARELLPLSFQPLQSAITFLAYGDINNGDRLVSQPTSRNSLEIAVTAPSPAERTALVQYLFSAPFFAAPSATTDFSLATRFRGEVTRREPLVPAVSGALDCPSPLVSRIKNIPHARLMAQVRAALGERAEHRLNNLGLSLHLVVNFLRNVPLSNIPEFTNQSCFSKTFDDFSRCFASALDLSFPERGMQREQEGKGGLISAASLHLLEIFGEGTKGQWGRLSPQLTKERLERLHDVYDMIHALSRATILPHLIRERENPALDVAFMDERLLRSYSNLLCAAALAQETSMLGVIKISEEWHRVCVGQNSASQYQYFSWLPLIPEQRTPNGCIITPLTNTSALVQEGSEMHHCVGGYGLYCARGESHIFSIRTANNARLSTLELRLEKEGDKPKVALRQNRAAYNGAPAPEAGEAAAWLVKECNEERILINWSALAKQSVTQSASAACGFDPNNSQAWQEQYCAIRAFLPREIAMDSPQAFLRAIDLERMILNIHAIQRKIQSSLPAN